MNPIAIRMLSGQLASPQFRRAEEVVAWFGAMQAQEYQMMRWAVAMRTKRPSIQDFRRAFDEGHIIRTHLFRTTWQLVIAEDLRWMLDLCREKNRRAINGFLKYYGDSISEQEYDRGCAAIERYVGDHPDATKEDITLALQSAGIAGSPHHISILIRRAEIDGIICNGRLSQGRENTYSLLNERVPSIGPSPSREEALALLARKYFRSHAPATEADFIWWSGLSAKDCRQAIGSIQSELHTTRFLNETYYIHSNSRTRGFRPGRVTLLPSYDEYLIAYKSRHIALAPQHTHYAHNTFGIFHPVVLIDGRVAGNWKMTGRGVSTHFFDAEPSPDALSSEKARYTDFIATV